MLNSRNNDIQAESEFCGLNVKFADKPRNATREEIKSISELFGKFEKLNITGLFLDKYQLTEGALCVCKELKNNKFLGFLAGADIKQRTIDDFGMATFFERNNEDEPSIRNRYQYIVPSNDSLCHIFQFDRTLINSNRDSIFFDSVTAIKSKTNSPVKTTTKDITTTIKDRLVQLEALKKDGLINQSDFEAKKKVILDSL